MVKFMGQEFTDAHAVSAWVSFRRAVLLDAVVRVHKGESMYTMDGVVLEIVNLETHVQDFLYSRGDYANQECR